MPPKALASPPKKGQDLMRVYGNYFIPEMRTACALLELNEVPYSADNIDIFSHEGRTEYLSLNPAGQYPTLMKGIYTIVADPAHIYQYICRSEDIDQKFYPMKDMNKDKRKIID